ncbi:glycoside hydrolase family 43 protein [Streptomyces johnsoniae]|uniref:Glycoside hydrolase family 43 protein n=1 Tax=Streptomyces johnsoniae TaxID=3075532 RepID=A0ABU2S171_9ACTN|nr:glycoside hydrolase family 43 protein [Streptomyces sp. DSM 41886]MDT0442690.1 glycoside hydrolase family 43 protein [Streptomyces sp. DSM 41886]
MSPLPWFPGKRALAAAALASAVVVTTAQPAAAAPRIVIDTDFPDPDVLAVDGTYYAYATNSGDDNVQVASAGAVDGTWERQGDALPQLGDWARSGLTWAPDVSERPDGSYLLYYTARDTASDRQCIGTAVSDSPAGPFAPVGDGPLVCPAEAGGAIDAASFTDTDGSTYLLYKNDGNAVGADTWLYLQRVSADGLTLEGDPVRLLKQDRPEEGGLIEAPTLVARGGSYVLLYSAGFYGDGSYFTGYATAPALTGPYTKSDTPLLTTEETGIPGPGGQDVVGDGTDDWLVFHGVLSEEPLVRGMYVAPLHWAGDVPSVG